MSTAPFLSAPSAFACRAPLLRVENLGVRFGAQWALRGVDLHIWQGDVLAFIGPNGAGKTTLLRAILGLVQPAEGRMVQDYPDLRIGYVPQRLSLDAAFPLTVEEFLAVNLRGPSVWCGGLPQNQRKDVEAVLERLHAADLSRKQLGVLSGGQFQRILIAAALLQKPEILLLDEPSASIDRRGTEELQTLLQDLHRTLRITIVFVSHDLHFVRHLADRVGCLNQSFCGLGPPQEILSESFLAEAYGAPQMRANFLFPLASSY
jgi:zinc transport system ATP-binding protein